MNNKNSLSNKETRSENINKNPNNSNNNTKRMSNQCNSSYDRSLQQSPKIRTGKYRPLSSKPKPFSLLDFDDKKNLSKGINYPAQYNRLNEEQLTKFNSKIKDVAGNNNDKKMLIQNYLNGNNKNNKGKRNENNKANTIDATKQKYNVSNNKLNANKKLTIDTKESYNFDDIDKNNKNGKNFKKTQNEIQENKNNFKRSISAKLRQKRDRWLPKGYPHYEYCILNPKYFQENIKKNPLLKIEKIHNIKEIKQKSNHSDIFFLEPPSEKETKLLVIGNNDKSKNYDVKLGSDVFNIKNDFSNLIKSSETYLFRNKIYPISSESKSYWTPRSNIPSYMNSPSVEYNILNPKAKCNTKTKEKQHKFSRGY